MFFNAISCDKKYKIIDKMIFILKAKIFLIIHNN